MDTNEEVRRRRLKQLCDANGGLRAVAAKAEMNWQSLDQVIKRVLLPPKADGSQSPKALGDAAARDLERAYGLGEGWMDWPFEHVDFSAWAALDPTQRVFAEGQIAAAISAAAKTVTPAFMNKKPVTDKKVEQHFPALAPEESKAAHERATRRQRSSIDLPGADDLFSQADDRE